MGKLDGKVALITGAARGQGRSHATLLAAEGADIIALDVCEQLGTIPYPLATKADLDETARLIEALGRRVVTRVADVRDTDALRAAVAAGVEQFGRIDVVCANAGVFAAAPVVEIDDDMWDEMIGVVLTGVFKTVRAALPAMIEGGRGGSIIITSSTQGIRGFANSAHYTAAKHGVVGLMRAMVQDLSANRIRVNTVNPTTVDTDMVQNEAMYELFEPTNPSRNRESFATGMQAAMHVLPIPWLEPIDVSQAVLWLASDDARYVTGIALSVDAGWSSRG